MTFWKKKSDELEGQTSQASDSSSDMKSASPKSSAAKTATQPPVSATPPEQDLPSSPQEHLTQKYGKVRSALGSGTIIQGKLSFDTPVRIDGKLSGEVYSSKALIVGPTGQIDATIDAACLVIFGQVKGNVKASEKIELYSGGQLEGQVQTPALVIESGARFHGSCDMGVKSKVASVAGKESKNKGKASTDTTIISDDVVDLANVLSPAPSSVAKDENLSAKSETKENVEKKESAPSLH